MRFCNNPLSFFQGLLGSKDGPVPGTTYLQGINSGQVSVNPKTPPHLDGQLGYISSIFYDDENF